MNIFLQTKNYTFLKKLFFIHFSTFEETEMYLLLKELSYFVYFSFKIRLKNEDPEVELTRVDFTEKFWNNLMMARKLNLFFRENKAWKRCEYFIFGSGIDSFWLDFLHKRCNFIIEGATWRRQPAFRRKKVVPSVSYCITATQSYSIQCQNFGYFMTVFIRFWLFSCDKEENPGIHCMKNCQTKENVTKSDQYMSKMTDILTMTILEEITQVINHCQSTYPPFLA